MNIHPTAIVDPKAELDSSVKVGAYSVIKAGVRMAEGCVIESHCVIDGPSTFGENNRIYSHAVIGLAPQDKKFKLTDKTELIVGDNNTFREFITINRGTLDDAGKTVIGSYNLIMSNSHTAHDCVIGSHTVIGHNSALAGHVVVKDHAILGGFTLIHQFVHIGRYVMTGINSVIRQDIPSYLKCNGQPAAPFGVNSIGLDRHAFSKNQISLLKKAFKVVYLQNNKLTDALTEIASWQDEGDVLSQFVADIDDSKKRGLARPKKRD